MKNLITRPVFWQRTWENLIKDFLKKSYGLTLYSPRVLVEDIITEIEENDLRNQDNRDYFLSKLNSYIKDDPIIKKCFLSQFVLLRNTFNSHKYNLLLEIARDIEKQFKEGLYFNHTLQILRTELLKDESISSEFISLITRTSQNLIVEFLKTGYALEDIKVFPSNILDNHTFQVIDGIRYLKTNYPHEIDYNDFIDENNNFDRESYNRKIEEILSALTLKDRIDSLSKYFNKEKYKVKYIFVVEGLKGNETVKIGPVTLYSPDTLQFITDDGQREFEYLQRNENGDDPKVKFIQAAVDVDFLLPKSSLRDALTKLESVLDTICCYFNTSTPLEIDSSNYVIVRDGRYFYSSWNRSTKQLYVRHQNSLELDGNEDNFREVIHNTSFLWESKDTHRKSRLLNAIHWFSKAEQSVKPEDKILNYWIAVENLFNLEVDIKSDIVSFKAPKKIHLVQEIISSTYIFTFVYAYGWELYHHYEFVVRNRQFKPTNIPDDIIERANLNPKKNEKIYLNKFIECLDDIEELEADLVILEKIRDVKNFYNDSGIQRKIIENQLKIIKDDILMIYRFRNLIVHNAHFDNTLLPYFVWKIKNYARHLIHSLLIESQKSDANLYQLHLNLHIKKQKFLADLRDGHIVNFFKSD